MVTFVANPPAPLPRCPLDIALPPLYEGGGGGGGNHLAYVGASPYANLFRPFGACIAEKTTKTKRPPMKKAPTGRHNTA